MNFFPHPRRFLQVILGLALLTFTQCQKPDGTTPATAKPDVPTPPAQASPNSIALIPEGQSPAFRAVASRLELGGCSFEYSEAGGAAALAAFLDELIKALPASERADMPAGFTVAKLFSLLGVDSIAAVGSSSRARADGSFHSRSIAYMPKGRKGMMTLSGGTAAKLLLHDVAPKDTDLALEFPISLRDFAREGLPGLLEMMPAAERAQFEQQMSEPIPPIGMSGRQMMEKLDARAGIFLRLDPAKKIQLSPAAPAFPGVDGVIVLERMGWLFEALKPQFMPMLEGAASPVAVSNENGVFTLRFKSPAGPPPMDYQPVLRFDAKADRILIATRTALFDSVVSGAEKITQGADFTQAWRDLPAEANMCLYASPRLLQTITELIAASVQSSGAASAADTAIFRKMLDWVRPLISRGHAVVLTNQPDGIVTMANTSIPAASSTMAGVSTVAVLAGLAVPAYAKARERATDVHDMSELRQVAIGLKMYASDNNGKYPAALSELVPKYSATNVIIEFTDHRTKQRKPWLYRATLTDSSPGSELLLAAPVASGTGERAVAFNDGSVKRITEAEFQKLWKPQ